MTGLAAPLGFMDAGWLTRAPAAASRPISIRNRPRHAIPGKVPASRWLPSRLFLAALSCPVWSKAVRQRSRRAMGPWATRMGASDPDQAAASSPGLDAAKQHLKSALLDDPSDGERAAGASPRWARLLEAFANVDKDGNGRISKDELLKAVKDKGVTEEEIAQALEVCDADHDGEINYAEFVKMLR
mmetsp:Transcript_17535/g.32987  ORF Transcript_17535/g.32987 Transcript_17535/m.32987 type:complete len:186 (-) Transcript_17535:60-617(-)